LKKQKETLGKDIQKRILLAGITASEMTVFDMIEPVTSDNLLKSAIWFGVYMLYHFCGAKFLPSISGYGFMTPLKTRKDY